jgi:hypothetical protein
MRLSPLDLQWVLNAEFLPLAAVTLAAGALGDRFGQKRIFLARIALYGLGARVFSTVGLGGLGAGRTNRSGLNLWVLVTLIIDLGGLAGLIVTERPLGDNAMLPRPSSIRRRGSALRSVHGHANLDPVGDHSGRGPSLHSPASADYGRLAARRHALSPVRPALAAGRKQSRTKTSL